MSYDSQAQSTYGATPFELFWFTMAPVFPAGISAQNWYLTSGDMVRTYTGNAYVECQISVLDGIQHDKELQAGAIDIEIPSDHPVAQLFLRGKPIAPVALTIFGGHDGDSEIVVKFSGQVKTATINAVKTKLHVAPDHQAVRKNVPCIDYQRPCGFIVYDTGCGIAIGASSPLPMSWDATVTSIDASNARIITVAGPAFDAYWLPNTHYETKEPTCAVGFTQLPSGRCIMIDDHSSANLLLQKYDDEIQVGVAVKVHRGCGRTLAHCKMINAEINFMGFEAIPANPFKGLY